MVDSTNEAAAVELLPCPFCKDGGTPSVYAPNPHVWCLTCDCAGPHLDTPEEAVAAWNTRAAIAAHAAALAGEVCKTCGGARYLVPEHTRCPDCTRPTSAPDVAALREPIVIDAVATVQLDREEGPYLDWLIEGGIADLAVGTVLMVSATNLTNDEGYGEVYVAQQETAHAKA